MTAKWWSENPMQPAPFARVGFVLGLTVLCPGLAPFQAGAEELAQAVGPDKAFALATRHGAAPSYRCEAAHSAVERAICADAGLAAKDREMAALHTRARQGHVPAVDLSQREWLATRNSCTRQVSTERALASCLEQTYDSRIAELGKLVAR
jgi:uncharacterized protein YecT (DUF1311 family)